MKKFFVLICVLAALASRGMAIEVHIFEPGAASPSAVAPASAMPSARATSARSVAAPSVAGTTAMGGSGGAVFSGGTFTNPSSSAAGSSAGGFTSTSSMLGGMNNQRTGTTLTPQVSVSGGVATTGRPIFRLPGGGGGDEGGGAGEGGDENEDNWLGGMGEPIGDCVPVFLLLGLMYGVFVFRRKGVVNS